jgi:hypothetical protein
MGVCVLLKALLGCPNRYNKLWMHTELPIDLNCSNVSSKHFGQCVCIHHNFNIVGTSQKHQQNAINEYSPIFN